MTFMQRKLKVQFTLQSGTFAGGGNSLTLTDLRMDVTVANAGMPAGATLQMAVFGMTLSQMNQLSTVGANYMKQLENTVTVWASIDGGGWAQIFYGVMTFVMFDGSSQPDITMHVSATSRAGGDVKPTPPTSVKGVGDVATMMEKLAKTAGLAFSNNKVNVKLSNPYLAGSIGAQIRTLARHAGVEAIIENGKLTITPPGEAPSSGDIVVSPETGMVGYPSFNQNQIIVKTIFNPNIKFPSKITVKSQLKVACGTWNVGTVLHHLESLTPRGEWFTTVNCNVPAATSAKDPATDG